MASRPPADNAEIAIKGDGAAVIEDGERMRKKTVFAQRPPSCLAVRRRTASLAVVLSLGVGVGGCAAILPPGPMQLGGDPGGVCVRSGGELVVVGDQFMIEGEAKAELTSVQLVNSSGLDLEEAFVIPIDGATMGTARYPPDINTWDQRVSVTEAVISPGEWMTFALVLKPVGTSGHTADGFRVSYEVAGSNFEKSNSTEYELAASCE